MGWFSRGRKRSDPVSEGETRRARPDLVVPMLSGQAWMDGNEEIFARIPDFPPGERPFAQPIADGLYLTYAIDPGPSWEVVGVDAAREYGDPTALRATAVANLRNRGDIRVQGDAGRYQLSVPDELDLGGSVLLDPTRWRRAIPVAGDLAVAIPTRVLVLLCAADDAGSVTALRAAAVEAFEAAEGKPVSPDLYRLSDSGLSALG